MKTKSTKLLLQSIQLIGWLCFGYVAQATDIVGGDMNYRYLGNDQYEISLTIFRDCDTGLPWFDNPANVYIYVGQTSNLFGQLRINYNPQINDTLDISLSDSCLTVTTSACIHTTTYTDTIVLPFNGAGYTIAYGRCCRNIDIVNIVGPTGTGAAYWTYISPLSLLFRNNSATFNEWPDVYLCAGVPLAIDQSATDVDGDSIVYELCTPSDKTNVSSPPPYPDVVWASPYSLNNMLGGPDSLRINPNTGLLEGTPQNAGVFLVGVCLKEYRNGALISQTRRDFQYIVGPCSNRTVASFDTVQPPCNSSLNIPFFNSSTGIFQLDYAWQFDVWGSSTATNPSFTFPDTGNYSIQLIADAGSLCADTITMPIYISLEGLLLSAPNDTLLCKDDTIELTVSNALDAYTDTVFYSWSPSADIISGADNDTALAFLQANQTYTVIGVNSHGCADTAQSNGYILYPSPVLSIRASADSIFVGQQVDLLATNDATYSYNWIPDTTLSSYSIYDPTARPRQSNYYYLLVENTLGCITLDSILIVIKEPTCGLPVVFIPNAFSPDGDGHNDELFVNGNNITSMTLSVYNRWGERVFETNDQAFGWDGNFKGSALPPDVYGYYLQCVCDDGSVLRTKGNITLLR
ncbi:MAG: gliding motility-associated C-terminal domain-containing protein [Aureispira sp.]